MAVKLALGETHIIQQTKQMLAEEVCNFLLGCGGVVIERSRLFFTLSLNLHSQGVNLELLERAARRVKGVFKASVTAFAR